MSVFWVFPLLLILLLTSTPISVALGSTVLVYFFLFTSAELELIDVLSQRMFTGLESFPLMAVPFFILSGVFLMEGGSAKRIVEFAKALVGSIPGGLGIATILACSFFATISGSSPATVIAIGSIMLPAMINAGYPKRFSVGVIATGGSLGILIPPSIVLIIYAVSTSQSTGKMFLAGVIPGVLLAVILMSTVYLTALVKGFPTSEKTCLSSIWNSFKKAIWGLMLVIIVLGGIYGGVFTPTEAAAVSAVYAFVVAVWVERGLKLADIKRVLLSAASTSSMILYIIANAMLFSYLLTTEGAPQAIANWVIDSNLSPYLFLLALNLALLVAGQFMEPSSVILILAPLALPIAIGLGIDPVHLGVIMTINMEIGMITPPVGLNLFVASHLAKIGISQAALAAIPWTLIMLCFLMLVTFVPQLSLWLPSLVYN